MSTKKTKSKPVLVKGVSLGEMLNSLPRNVKPMTAEEKAEHDKLLQELIKSQGPGDALFVFGMPKKKS